MQTGRGGRTRRLALAATMLALGLPMAAGLGCRSSSPVLASTGEIATPASLSSADAPRAGLETHAKLDSGAVSAARIELGQRVTLPGLLILAANRHPELRRARAELLAVEGDRIQADAVPNPRLEAEVRRIPIQSDRSFDEANIRVDLLQPLPILGMRAAAMRSADSAVQAALWQTMTVAAELELALRLAFVRWWVAVEQLPIAAQRITLMQARLATLRQLRQLGVVPQTEVLAAEAALGEARLARDEIAIEEAHAIEGLRRAAGDGELVLGTPPKGWGLPSLPAEDRLPREWATLHPAAQAARYRAGADSLVAAARRTYRDAVEIGIGYEYEGRGNIHWLTAILNVPLPLFDRGDGAEQAARARAEAALAERDRIAGELMARRARLLDEQRAASRMLATIESEIVPALEARVRLLRERENAAAAGSDPRDEDSADPLRMGARARAELETQTAQADLLAAQIRWWRARGRVAATHHALQTLLSPVIP